MFITTTGVGVVPAVAPIGGRHARPGDAVLSGTIGDHGVAVLSSANRWSSRPPSNPTPPRCTAWWRACSPPCPKAAMRTLRDPTRGGLATTLNEIAKQSGVGMLLDEGAIPIKPQVHAACELLGLDPLYIANEGKCIVICDAAVAEGALERCVRTRSGARRRASAASPTTRSVSCRWTRPSAAGAWSTGSASCCRASADAGILFMQRDVYRKDRGGPRRDPQPRPGLDARTRGLLILVNGELTVGELARASASIRPRRCCASSAPG